MKYVFLIALREFAENAKTKGFWIGILLFPVMLFVGIRVPTFLQQRAVPTRNFVLLDASGEFEKVIDEEVELNHFEKVLEERSKKVAEHVSPEQFQAVASQPRPRMSRSQLRAMMLAQRGAGDGGIASDDVKRKVVRVPAPPGVDAKDPKAMLATLRPYLNGTKKYEVEPGKYEELFALVLIPKDLEQTRTGVEYWCTNLADDSLKSIVERGLNDELRRREFVRTGVAQNEVERIQELRILIEGKDPKRAEGAEKVGDIDEIRQWVPVGFVYLLWVAIFTVAQMLLNNTVEEKSNRIIEVLVSSVTPTELMFGKLLGIAAVGLTMVSAWIASLLILLPTLGAEAKIAKLIFDAAVTPSLLTSFVLYFVLGYLLYAAIFLAMGSLVNSIKEAQNLMGPVMLIMFVPLITMMFIPKDPNGVLAVALSWVPLYTPFVMMNRMAASPPMFDVVGTSVLLIVFVGIMIWLSGKIFRVGILRTGQPPKLLELVRWLRQ